MPQPKGQTGNPNGRPKGTLNKTTKELKETVQAFLSQNMNDLQHNYDQLEARDKLIFFERLLRYAMPTQAAVKAEIELEKQEQVLIISGKKFANKDEGLKELAGLINSDEKIYIQHSTEISKKKLGGRRAGQ